MGEAVESARACEQKLEPLQARLQQVESAVDGHVRTACFRSHARSEVSCQTVTRRTAMAAWVLKIGHQHERAWHFCQYRKSRPS